MDTKAILKKHNKLNFVRRILDPSIYPNIANKDGTISTHKMAYSESDGKYYVYPTIVQNKDGKLKELDEKSAWEYAKSTNELIEFEDEKEAAAFAKGGYKKYSMPESYKETKF